LFIVEVLDYLLSQTRKPTDVTVSVFAFLSDSVEIVEISTIQKKSENALCQYVKLSVLSLYAIGFGEKLELG